LSPRSKDASPSILHPNAAPADADRGDQAPCWAAFLVVAAASANLWNAGRKRGSRRDCPAGRRWFLPVHSRSRMASMSVPGVGRL